MHRLTKMYEYLSETRKGYLDLFEKMPWEDVTRDRGASYGSLRDVFLHTLNAHRWWFVFVSEGRPLEWTAIEFPSVTSVKEVRRLEAEVDAAVMRVVARATEADLKRVHHDDEEPPVAHTLEAMMLHMIEEELQHRGEINCMVWQADLEAPVVGYQTWVQGR